MIHNGLNYDRNVSEIECVTYFFSHAFISASIFRFKVFSVIANLCVTVTYLLLELQRSMATSCYKKTCTVSDITNQPLLKS